MNKNILLPAIALLLLVAAVSVLAQQPTLGCCCDPVTRSGQYGYQSTCISPFIFVSIPSTGFAGCNFLCNATNVTAPPVAPPPVSGVCNAPGYTPPVANLIASPVTGERAIQLDFNVPCPADNVKVYRCDGAGCTNFSWLETINGDANQYVDDSADLLWNKDYTYKVIARYSVSGDSDDAVDTANTGDIECWHQEGDIFCLSSYFYDNFKDYLKEHGYKMGSADEFKAVFAQTRDDVFNNFYGRSWFCNAMNKLSTPAPQVSCGEDEICVSDGDAARCVEQIECGVTGAFGLFDLETCEQDSDGRKYCVLDKSSSIVDACYACDPRMTCNDYHSEGSCQRDNCGVGDCEWVGVFPDLGMGVCVDTRFDACSLCQAQPGQYASNKIGYSSVFDACSEAKALALSTTDNPCFFDKDTNSGVSCKFVACDDYTQSQCGSPAGGIQLNPDNSLKVRSTDVCSIGVCQYSSTTGCVKNANGASGSGWQDCLGAEDIDACEKDRFAPETLVVLTGDAPGKHDYIDFIITDKTRADGRLQEMQGTAGYETHLCIVSSTDACADAKAFPIVVNTERLNINDLSLQDGQDVIGSFASGTNVVKYYSVDKNNNVEVVKSVNVFACDNCDGPDAIEVKVTGGKKVGTSFYTKVIQPTITIVLNEPATMTAVSLDLAGAAQSVAVSPSSGAGFQYTITPTAPLSEGTYSFSFNSQDDQAVLMDAPVIFDLVIDTTPPTVSIRPVDGAEFDNNNVALDLSFNEPVFFNKTTLNEVLFIDEFVKTEVPILLSRELQTSNNKDFSGVVTNLRAGLKVVNVDVTDYASNPLKTRSYFSVLAGPPQIRIKHPSWGISSVLTFNVTIETSTKADCKYIAGVPSAPPASQYDSLSSFDSSDGIEHVIEQVSITYGAAAAYPLHVYCKTDKFNITHQSFGLVVDSIAPKIMTAYANPNPIVEPVAQGVDVYSTRLQVQTDEDSFCKYSADKQEFNEMEGFFPGFDEVPKTAHSVAVNVSAIQGYTYYVACKDKAGLLTQATPITFVIDLSVPFSIKSITEPYSNTELFTLGVDSNKRAFCYFGENTGGISTCFGACEFTNGHSQLIRKSPGMHTFYVRCNTGATGESSNTLNITVFVDTSPPVMEYVDDSSTLPGEPDISWYPDKLKVKFHAKDPETRVVKYWYLLETAFAREVLVNWTPSLELNGTPVFVKAGLVDGQRYVFRVKPENLVGLVGNYSTSDGVTIDVSKIPPACEDGETGRNETDVDCGGMCAGCEVGKKCKQNNDCASLYCAGGRCDVPSCTDEVKNGEETDIDCGGSGCTACALNMTCAEDIDCASGKCKYGICVIPGPCENGLLDGSESGVDCGGSCPGCGSGMNCNMQGDCLPDLACVDGTCGESQDFDNDGVLDHIDKCPNTPPGEIVDAEGCSAGQVFSCGDPISDAWRVKNFGSVVCDGEGAPDADPDKDGLTNLEEYRLQTLGSEKDTDKDGWSDGKEVKKGTNPLDAGDHPVSLLWTLFKWLLILGVLGGIGYGGYYAYKKGYLDKALEKFRKKPVEFPEVRPVARPVPKPVPKGPTPEDKIAALRKFAKAKEAPSEEEEFVSVEDLKKRAPKVKVKKKEVPGAKAFERLRGITGKEVPVLKEKPKKSKESAIEKLRKMKKGKK